MKLKIRKKEESEGKARSYSGRDFQYWLDDLEITDSLAQLDLSMGNEQVNSCSITLMVDDADVDTDALLQLAAIVQVKEAEEDPISDVPNRDGSGESAIDIPPEDIVEEPVQEKTPEEYEARAKELYALSDQGEWADLSEGIKRRWVAAAMQEGKPEVGKGRIVARKDRS